MGLIAFPFVLCFICSPLIIGGVILYLSHQNQKERDERMLSSDEVIAARNYYSSKVNRYVTENHMNPPSDMRIKWIADARSKYGVSLRAITYKQR